MCVDVVSSEAVVIAAVVVIADVAAAAASAAASCIVETASAAVNGGADVNVSPTNHASTAFSASAAAGAADLAIIDKQNLHLVYH